MWVRGKRGDKETVSARAIRSIRKAKFWRGEREGSTVTPPAHLKRRTTSKRWRNPLQRGLVWSLSDVVVQVRDHSQPLQLIFHRSSALHAGSVAASLLGFAACIL